jgi:hypothetical protein
MSHVIPEEKFLKEGQGSQHEGGSGDLRTQQRFGWKHSVDTSRRSSFEERKVRRNPKENLAKMDENSDLKNRVRIKMNKLNLVVV